MLYAIEAIMKKPSMAICVLFCFLCVGCMIIPIPTREHTPAEYCTRGEIEAEAFDFVRVGSTSREEVLLKLGEPDAVREDERRFLYRWVTVHGYLAWGTYGGGGDVAPIGVKRFDLLIEFDDQGVVKRLGDIKTWAENMEGQKEPPLDLSTPIEIPVIHARFPALAKLFRGDTAATLILGKDFVEFRESKPSHNFRISPEKIILLKRYSETDEYWNAGELHYYIRFSEKTEAGKGIHIRVDFFSSLTLLKYLRQNCPNLEVKN